jgi:hypothetical protein
MLMFFMSPNGGKELLVNYTQINKRDYYRNGSPRRDYRMIKFGADRQSTQVIATSVTKIISIGIWALVSGLLSGKRNPYALPR